MFIFWGGGVKTHQAASLSLHGKCFLLLSSCRTHLTVWNSDAVFMPRPDACCYEIPQHQRNEDELTGFNFALKRELTWGSTCSTLSMEVWGRSPRLKKTSFILRPMTRLNPTPCRFSGPCFPGNGSFFFFSSQIRISWRFKFPLWRASTFIFAL